RAYSTSLHDALPISTNFGQILQDPHLKQPLFRLKNLRSSHFERHIFQGNSSQPFETELHLFFLLKYGLPTHLFDKTLANLLWDLDRKSTRLNSSHVS